MKLSSSLLLPVITGAAVALSDSAKVYIFQGDDLPNASDPPALSAEQARLVLAQRLGTSQYHQLGAVDESTVSYINKFGGSQGSLFQDPDQDKTPELVVIVEGVTSSVAEMYFEASAFKPAFTISKPPSMAANSKLVSDLDKQLGREGKNCDNEKLEAAINPFSGSCWSGRSKVVHFDLGFDTAFEKVKILKPKGIFNR